MAFPKLHQAAVLSPMAGVTDVAFRALAKKYGAAITYTEFASAAALVRKKTSTFQMIRTAPTEKPVAVQLFGSNLKEVVEAARLVQDNFDIIDINCGCPAWSVIRTGAGSELLKNPQELGKFVSTLVNAVSKPVTVKIRTGIDEKSINVLETAKIIQESGAAALAIHGRTQKQGYSGVSDWSLIKQVKETLDIPVIGNGDVFSPEDFKEKIEYSNVDGIMIARGAMTNPYIFQQIQDYMRTGTYKEKDKLELFFEYLELAQAYELPFSYIKHHAIQFTKGIEGGAEVRDKLSTVKETAQLKEIMGKFHKN